MTELWRELLRPDMAEAMKAVARARATKRALEREAKLALTEASEMLEAMEP